MSRFTGWRCRLATFLGPARKESEMEEGEMKNAPRPAPVAFLRFGRGAASPPVTGSVAVALRSPAPAADR
jgi:hypothetical protein